MALQLCTWLGGPLLVTLHALAILFAAGEARGAQLTVSWVDNSNAVATTRLERRGGNSTTFAAIADLPAGVTKYIDASVVSGTTYCYRALVYNAIAVSPYSDEACASPSSASPLTLVFTDPANETTVSGTATVSLSASGGSGYTFTVKVDGATIYAGSDGIFTWNTAAVANGTHALTATVTDSQNHTARATLTVTVANVIGRRAVNDFDGDGRTDLAVYRPSTGEWFIYGSTAGFSTVVFGAPAASGLGDTPVPADYDGDGKTDLAIYRKATGEWFIFGTASGFRTLALGAPAASGLGDIPVPADFDGDGKADPAIFRPATGEWFIFSSASGFSTVVFGAPASNGLGDTPVPADYDGDGKTDLAIYRKATGEWFIFGTASGFRALALGAPAASGLSDIPVPADFDGDGKADPAIFRPATGEWFIFGSLSGFRTRSLGVSTGLADTPVPADYDGDGQADIALFRPSTSQWLVLRSVDGQTQSITWDVSTDLPLPQPTARR